MVSRTPRVWHVAPNDPTALPAALAAARGSQAKGKRIVLGKGTHSLGQPVALGPDDAGLTLEGEEGVVLSGGVRVSGWQREGKLWVAPVPAAAVSDDGLRVLVMNGRLCPRARWPREGYLTHQSEFSVRWLSSTEGGWERKPTVEELGSLRYDPEDLPAAMDLSGAEVRVYHMWDESLVGVARRDRRARRLYFRNPAGHPPGAYDVHKYVVWNVREGLTEPGQWYYERKARRLLYWPLPGEKLATAEGYVPVARTLIQLAGTETRPIEGVTVRGLGLTLTTTPLVAGGFGAQVFPAAVMVEHARGCRLEGLEVYHAGGWGIRGKQCEGLEIRGCDLRDLGAGGITVRGKAARIDGNRLCRVGRTYPSAIALAWGGPQGRISRNELHHNPYSAITSGGDDNVIEGNHISFPMEELCDGGAIYSFGGKRLVMRGNFAHDVSDLRRDTGGPHACAYYLDEQSEDCVVEGNLSARIERCFQAHMSRRNMIRGNTFLSDTFLNLRFPRSGEHRVVGNVLYARGRVEVSEPEAVTEWRGNRVFSETGEVSVP